MNTISMERLYVQVIDRKIDMGSPVLGLEKLSCMFYIGFVSLFFFLSKLAPDNRYHRRPYHKAKGRLQMLYISWPRVVQPTHDDLIAQCGPVLAGRPLQQPPSTSTPPPSPTTPPPLIYSAPRHGRDEWVT